MGKRNVLNIFAAVLVLFFVSQVVVHACPVIEKLEANPNTICINGSSKIKATIAWNGYNQNRKYFWKATGPNAYSKSIENTKKNVTFPGDFDSSGGDLKAGVYTITLDIKGYNKKEKDWARASDKQSESDRSVTVTVVEVDHLEYRHEDCLTFTVGNPTISVGTKLTIKAVPNPETSWPSGTPIWTIIEKPSGSSVTAPPKGSQSPEIIFDKKGIYKIKASCGVSFATIRIIVKELAINIIGIHPDGQLKVLPNLLENENYTSTISLTGGSSNDFGTVTWRYAKASGQIEADSDWGWMATTRWTKTWETDKVDKAPAKVWNYISWYKVDVDNGEGDTDWDLKNIVVHREWEVDLSPSWNHVGWDNEWQHFDTCQSGDSVKQSVTVNEIWTVKYSLTSSSKISAGAESVLKVELGFSQTFGIAYSISIGLGYDRTISIPTTPAEKYWGVFWRIEIQDKTCNVYKWDKYGNKTDDGTLTITRKEVRVGRSHEPADNFADACNHFPQ